MSISELKYFVEKLDCYTGWTHADKRPSADEIERFSRLPSEEKEEIYNLADQKKYPFFNRPVAEEVKASTLYLNFIWINKSPEDCGDCIAPDSSFARINEWVCLNPGSNINFWFDHSFFIDRLYMIQALRRLLPRECKLRSIREIGLVQENPHLFAPSIPVYFRVDLLKAFILHQSQSYSLMADLDIQPLSNKEIFTKMTFLFLKKYGFVMMYKPFKYENGFIMVNGAHLGFKKSHEAFIRMCIENGNKFFKTGFFKKLSGLDLRACIESVYFNYEFMKPNHMFMPFKFIPGAPSDNFP